MKKLALALAGLTLLTSCATVLTGTNQTIKMTAVDRQTNDELSAVSCTVKDTNGVSYPLASNPGTVVVSKNKEPLQVHCRQTGYQDYTGAINSSFNAVALLDILFWPTFFVDYATGAMQKYPGSYQVEMKKAS